MAEPGRKEHGHEGQNQGESRQLADDARGHLTPAGTAGPQAGGLGILSEGVHLMKVKTKIKAGPGEGGWPGF